MIKALGNNKVRIAVILIIVLAVAGVSIYRSKSTKLLDKQAYSDFKAAVDAVAESEEGGFADQQALVSFIEGWADSNSLEYTEDKYGNIIFDREAAARKKNVSPTLVAVSLNYETATDNAQILASAASIALSDIESGRRTVVFFNDEQGLAKGYKGISKKKYLGSGVKIIYLDKGSSTYLSTGSFQQRFCEVSIPASMEDDPCDTAVRISITGINSGIIGPGIGKQPDPVSALSSLLTRLKSKSVNCRLASVSIGTNGNMYPVSLEATVVLNSYNLSSFTAYIDKRIKAWDKAYGETHENLVYEYEVMDDEESMPAQVYTAETTDRITGILYTIKGGAYRYSEGDALPEGKEPGDIYGINCLTALNAGEDSITLSMITQGVNDTFTERMINDNSAAASLYECAFTETDRTDGFVNDRDSLSRTFMNTYTKVNANSTADAELRAETDNFFTPCSYLAARSSKADIIHIRTKGSAASRVANTILCYIKTKGNTSLF